MTIENLINLDNLLNNDNCTSEELVEAINDNEEICVEWIGSIKETLKSSSDSGLHDYYAMYWFIKELKLPEP